MNRSNSVNLKNILKRDPSPMNRSSRLSFCNDSIIENVREFNLNSELTITNSNPVIDEENRDEYCDISD